MRVISQDGCYDIPYEQAALQRCKEKIYLMSKNFFDVEGITVNPVIAEYSTERLETVPQSRIPGMHESVRAGRNIGF